MAVTQRTHTRLSGSAERVEQIGNGIRER
jgi:hypothetical protein